MMTFEFEIPIRIRKYAPRDRSDHNDRRFENDAVRVKVEADDEEEALRKLQGALQDALAGQ